MLVDMHAHVIPGALEAVGSRGPSGTANRSVRRGRRTPGCSKTTAGCSSRRSTRSTRPSAGSRSSSAAASTPRSSRRCRRCSTTRCPAAEGLELSRRVNEFIASLCAADPARLMGMGMVPMQAPELAIAELARVRDLGLVAVEIASNVLGTRAARRGVRGVLVRGRAARDADLHPRDAGRLRGAAAGRA